MLGGELVALSDDGNADFNMLRSFAVAKCRISRDWGGETGFLPVDALI